MNKTKIYCVEVTSMYSFSMGGTLIGFFLSKQEAEFYAWQKNSRTSDIIRNYYSVKEIESLSVSIDNKEYKKFLNEKIKKLDEEIKKKSDCAEKDSATIKDLEEEKEEFKKQL